MTKFFAGVKRFVREEDAPTMAEYGLMLVLVGFVAAAGAALLGGGLNTLFTGAGNEVSTATVPALP